MDQGKLLVGELISQHMSKKIEAGLGDLMANFELPVFDAEAVPLVALDSMNETHFEEIELINQLGDLIVAGLNGEDNDSSIDEKIDEWLEHTRLHFESENRLMLDNGFPAYPVHSSEHERVLEQMESISGQWKSSRNLDPLAEYLFVTWPSWFENHVKTMDAVTAQFLKIVL